VCVCVCVCVCVTERESERERETYTDLKNNNKTFVKQFVTSGKCLQCVCPVLILTIASSSRCLICMRQREKER